MATVSALTPRIYVGNQPSGGKVGLGDRKNVHFSRDKNLQLAIFVPDKARADTPNQGSHIATGVSRKEYHALRAWTPAKLNTAENTTATKI